MLNIKQRQLNLYYYGYYYTGKIDNIEGPLLKAAYGNFQKDHGLVVDRIYGPKTEKQLLESVKSMQTKLNDNGAKLTVDGLIGNKTIAAVKKFQKKKGLAADGIAGRKTLPLLYKSQASEWSSIRYFKRDEFGCGCKGKCCSGFPAEPDMQLVRLLDNLRAYFGVPITITSGVRCTAYNRQVGGISGSMHLKGKAADIYVPGASKAKVKAKAYELGAKYSYYGTPGMGNAVHINI